MLRPLIVAVVAAVSVCFSGCKLPEPAPITEANLYVDNGRDQPIAIAIDGGAPTVIPAGKSQRIVVKLGERHIAVTSDNSLVYDAMHTLEAPQGTHGRPAYMFNPDHSFRYCRVSIVYGNDSITTGAGDGLANMITRIASKKAVGDDPEAQREWIERKNRERKFRSLIDSMSMFGDEPMSRFVSSQYTLQPMPTMVIGSRHSMSEKRSTVVRVPPDLYDAVQKAALVKEPNDGDVEYAQTLKLLVESLVSHE